ncbi:MAG: hypothetical protein EZS28_016668, partial [Streblomastix strix]
IVRVFEFPMTGSVGKIVFDFFAYLDFSISWSSNTFLIVMTTIFYVLISLAITGAVINGIIIKMGKNMPLFIIKFIYNFWQVGSSIFFIPMLNTFLGPFTCLFGNEGLQCQGATITTFLIMDSIWILFSIILALIFRLFMHPFDIRNAGLFSCQSGYFLFWNQLSTAIIILHFSIVHNSSSNSIINFTLLSKQAVIKAKLVCLIIGIVLTIILIIYALWNQPFYQCYGNAIHSAALGGKIFVFGEAIVLEILEMIKTNNIESDSQQLENYSIIHQVLIWVILFIGLIISMVISFFLAKLRAHSKWAIKRNQTILPILPGKDKKQKKKKQNEHQIAVANDILHNKNKSDQKQSPYSTNNLLFLSNFGDANDLDPLQDSDQVNIKRIKQQAEKPVKIKRLETENEALMSLRFLTDTFIYKGKITPQMKKKIRNNEFPPTFKPIDQTAVLNFAEQLLIYSQKKFPDSVDILLFSALFYRKFRVSKILTRAHTKISMTQLGSTNTNNQSITSTLTSTQAQLNQKNYINPFMRMNECLQIAKQQQPNMHQRWIMYCILHQMQKSRGENTIQVSNQESGSFESKQYIAEASKQVGEMNKSGQFKFQDDMDNVKGLQSSKQGSKQFLAALIQSASPLSPSQMDQPS